MENSNKTEQEKRIQELKNRERKEKITTILKRVGLWGGVFIGLAVMVWGLAKLGAPSQNGSGVPLSEPVSADDHSKGNSLAKVTLIEYSDFQCPACGQFYPVVKAAEEKFSKDVLFVYRHFPLPTHDKSNLAARASEAAAVQGKFWEMHDKLFENQTTWTASAEPEKLFAGYAEQIGINKDKFLADLKDPAVESRVQKDISSGNASGIQATPTFYLNGKMLNLQAYGDLEANIASALAENR